MVQSILPYLVTRRRLSPFLTFPQGLARNPRIPMTSKPGRQTDLRDAEQDVAFQTIPRVTYPGMSVPFTTVSRHTVCFNVYSMLSQFQTQNIYVDDMFDKNRGQSKNNSKEIILDLLFLDWSESIHSYFFRSLITSIPQDSTGVSFFSL